MSVYKNSLHIRVVEHTPTQTGTHILKGPTPPLFGKIEGHVEFDVISLIKTYNHMLVNAFSCYTVTEGVKQSFTTV